MTTSTTPTEEPVEEHVRVQRWRVRQLTRLGFSTTAAIRLADDGVDHHEAARLLGAGASLLDAYRILRA